jgi:hypothetical protein
MWIHRELWESRSFGVADCYPVKSSDMLRSDLNREVDSGVFMCKVSRHLIFKFLRRVWLDVLLEVEVGEEVIGLRRSGTWDLTGGIKVSVLGHTRCRSFTSHMASSLPHLLVLPNSSLCSILPIRCRVISSPILGQGRISTRG